MIYSHKRILIGFLTGLSIVLILLILFKVDKKKNTPTIPINTEDSSSEALSDPKENFEENQSMKIVEERMMQLMILPYKLDGNDLTYFAHKENGWLFFFNEDYSEARYILMQKGNVEILGGETNFQKDYGEDVIVRDPAFSPNLDQFAFVVSSKDTSFIVLNGDKINYEYKQVYATRFSPDSKRFGYIARKEDGSLVGVVDGQETTLTNESTANIDSGYTWIFFSPDSKRMAYVVNYHSKDSNNLYKAFVSLDGQKFNGYARVHSFVFSPDSNRYAFQANIGGINETVVDGIVQGTYEYTKRPVFSFDGKHVAYWAQNGMAEDLRKEFVVLDGKQFQTHPRVADVMFVPNRYEVGYLYCNSWIRGADCHIVVGNVKSEVFHNLGELEAIDSRGNPIYTTITEESGAGETLTYYSLNHKGKTGKFYDAIYGIIPLLDYNDAVVSAAIEHVDKYVSGKSFIVVDHNESTNRFDRVWSPKILESNKIAYAALSGTTIYQIQATVEPE